jgi:hypothetical protein
MFFMKTVEPAPMKAILQLLPMRSSPIRRPALPF